MKIFNNIQTKLVLSVLIIGSVISCNNKKEEQMKITWTQLPTTGLEGNLQKGVSAAYAAIIDGKLIVGGGCNFPDKLGFEGGQKAYYDEILMMDTAQTDAWHVIGKLPEAAAYGVSVPVSDGALWIGGNTDSRSLNEAYRLTLNDGVADLKPFPSLPAAMDNFAGCSVNDSIFVAGGSVAGKPSNAFFGINAKTDSVWTALPDFPGIARVQPVLSAVEMDGKTYVYLMGGFFGGNADSKPAMATDVYRFSVFDNAWEKVGEQIDSASNQPFSLGGATVAAIGNRYIICLGGVNHDVFLDAISTQYNINADNNLSPEEKKTKNGEFSRHYMTQPVEYYNFNKECRLFDTRTNTWQTIDVTPNAARAGATLVVDGNKFFAVQGELKPGVRTPETWKGIVE